MHAVIAFMSYLAKITSREEIVSFQTASKTWLPISIRVIKTIVTDWYQLKAQQLVN